MPRMRTVNYLRDRLYRPGAQVDTRYTEVAEARAMPGEDAPSPGGPLASGVIPAHRSITRGRRNGVPWTPYVWRGDTPDNIRRRREADAAFEEEEK